MEIILILLLIWVMYVFFKDIYKLFISNVNYDNFFFGKFFFRFGLFIFHFSLVGQ